MDAYLRAGVDRGDWRALDALVNRVYGKPKETVVSEQTEPEWKEKLWSLKGTDALTRIVHKNNPEAIRRMEENGTLKRVDDMIPEERKDLLRDLTLQPRLRAVEDLTRRPSKELEPKGSNGAQPRASGAPAHQPRATDDSVADATRRDTRAGECVAGPASASVPPARDLPAPSGGRIAGRFEP